MAQYEPYRIWRITMHVPLPEGAPPLFERQDLRHEAWVLGVELDPGETHEGLRERVVAAKAGDARAYSVSTWEPVRAQKKQELEAAQNLAIATGTSVDSMRAAIESVLQKTEREIPDLRRRLDEAIGQASAAVEQEIKNRAPSPQTWWDRSATFNGRPIPGGVFSGSMPVSVAPSGTPIPSTSAPTYPVRLDESVVDMVEREVEEANRHAFRQSKLLFTERGIVKEVLPTGEVRVRPERTQEEAVRAENRRVGEELAKAPPGWAYPLAWRLAVMAVVEAYNNTKTVVPFDTRYWEQKVALSLRAYHRARLDGLLPEPAMMKAVLREIAEPLDKAIVEKFYDGIACQAYERGRPGPGGVR